MCGIFSVLNNVIDIETVEKAFNKGWKRGPESNVLKINNTKSFILGFHRLAINGYQNPNYDQPININDCILICNGEIYNWKKLHFSLNIPKHTGSDCEIIIHLYKKYGIEHALRLLDGVFAFCLYDKKKDTMYFARDLFGIRPLFMANVENVIMFSSLMKCFTDFDKYGKVNVTPFTPGTYSMFKYDSSWKHVKTEKFSLSTITQNPNWSWNEAFKIIYDSLNNAVKKRILNTDRPIACLLSGGLDSSLITGLVKKNLPEDVILHTWSIGLEGSEDLKYAQKVADYLDTNHHSIVVSEKEFLEAIPEVINAIESYDTTTVRASVGNWLISKYIKENSEAKVIFNGDGSDEVSGGYMYFHYAPNKLDFDYECRRLLKDIHYFDVLRSDRSISSHGLEPRTPFLDKTFVQNYLSIPNDLRYTAHMKGCEKYLIREAFKHKDIIPREVLERTKEAFSDGVSSNKKSWYEVIQDYLKENYTPKETDETYSKMHNPPKTLEQKYYRDIFNQKFPTFDNVIPYFWMPKFIDATDASARTLGVYKDKQKSVFRK